MEGRHPLGERHETQPYSSTGHIKVESNARPTATSVNVIGDVQAENSRSVKLAGSTVGGSVPLVQGDSATIRNNHIEGTLLFDDNSGAGNKDDQCARL